MFKVGDKIVRLPQFPHRKLELNTVYTVSKVSESDIILAEKEQDAPYFPHKFILAEIYFSPLYQALL